MEAYQRMLADGRSAAEERTNPGALMVPLQQQEVDPAPESPNQAAQAAEMLTADAHQFFVREEQCRMSVELNLRGVLEWDHLSFEVRTKTREEALEASVKRFTPDALQIIGRPLKPSEIQDRVVPQELAPKSPPQLDAGGGELVVEGHQDSVVASQQRQVQAAEPLIEYPEGQTLTPALSTIHVNLDGGWIDQSNGQLATIRMGCLTCYDALGTKYGKRTTIAIDRARCRYIHPTNGACCGEYDSEHKQIRWADGNVWRRVNNDRSAR